MLLPMTSEKTLILYHPCMQGQIKTMPVDVRADIQGGQLRWNGKAVDLPIKGSGNVSVAYLDDSLRILRSATGIAVQVRQDVLQSIMS